MMWPNMMGGFGWGGIFPMLLGIALLVVLVWAVIRFVSRRTTSPLPPYTSAPLTGPSALEILNQRYARGEIDTVTYEQMRARLETPLARPPVGRP
jgi:putative membrane protein